MSLLRYFKPSLSTGAARELSTKALDVVFWPFSEYAHDDEDVESDEDDDGEEGKDAEAEEEEGSEKSGGSGLEDLREKAKRSRKRSRQQEKAGKAKRRRQAAEADGTSLFDKRLTAVKLLGLVRDRAPDRFSLGSHPSDPTRAAADRLASALSRAISARRPPSATWRTGSRRSSTKTFTLSSMQGVIAGLIRGRHLFADRVTVSDTR